MDDSIKCDFFCVRWDNSLLCKNVLYSKVIVMTMCVVKTYFYLLYKSASTFMSNDLQTCFLSRWQCDSDLWTKSKYLDFSIYAFRVFKWHQSHMAITDTL